MTLKEYQTLSDRIAKEIADSKDAQSAELWSKCLKNIAIAFGVDVNRRYTAGLSAYGGCKCERLVQ